MKNLSNRGKLLIAFALIVVIAVAAIVAGNLNRKDEGPAPLTYPIGVTLSMRLNEQGVNDLIPRTAGFSDESFGKTLGAVSALVNNATVRMTLDSGVFRTDLQLKEQDILYFAIKMAQDATGRYQIWGIISKEAGTYGLILDDTIDGTDTNTNYVYESWYYIGNSEDEPKLKWEDDKLMFSYPVPIENGYEFKTVHIDCGYDTGHMEFADGDE